MFFQPHGKKNILRQFYNMSKDARQCFCVMNDVFQGDTKTSSRGAGDM